MKWVLILVFITFDSTPPVVIPMESLPACAAAQATYREAKIVKRVHCLNTATGEVRQ